MPTRSTQIKRKTSLPPTIYLLIPLAFLLGLGTGHFLWASDRPAAGSQTALNMATLADDDPFRGPTDAPVTIIEFSDYQCPYCQLWEQQVYPRLMAEYSGQIRFIYRDLPIQGHPQALPAAVAANCAGEQNAYWPFHDALFSGQYELGRSTFVQYAADLGLNAAAFAACLDNKRNQDEPQKDFQDAVRLGINSTPTFVINGQVVVGAQPYENFKAIIDQALSAAR
jgi:protein-disulfide isomerase